MWLLTAALLVVAAVVKLLTPQHPPSDNNSNQTRSRWEWPGKVRKLDSGLLLQGTFVRVS